MPPSPREVLSVAAVAAVTLVATIQVPAEAVVAEPPKVPTARGSGGAVSSVDPYATQIGLEVLRNGGNATDAAVATAAALGVTEPYSAGIGGGGFFVHYDADTGQVQTIDGRETAPMGMPDDAFVNPATGQPYSFERPGQQRPLGRRARHPRHLAAGARPVGHAQPVAVDAPGDQARP